MSADCVDVCDAVITKLEEMGYDLTDDEDLVDHNKILEYLCEIEFVKKEQ
jgi:hypothetical protein